MSTRIIALLSELPLGAFRDERLFDQEVARFFRSAWCFALHRGRLSCPRQQEGMRVGGREILLVVDGEGRPRAFSNRCLHDGKQVLGTGQSKTGTVIRCPHHGWCYDLAGRLLRGPGFDVSGRARVGSLSDIPVSVEGSCVMVGPETGPSERHRYPWAPPVRHPLLIDSSSADLGANWKLVLLGLCETGWRYAFPNLAVAGDDEAMSLLRLEPLAPGRTHVAVDRVSRARPVPSKGTAIPDADAVAGSLRRHRAREGQPDDLLLDRLAAALVAPPEGGQPTRYRLSDGL